MNTDSLPDFLQTLYDRWRERGHDLQVQKSQAENPYTVGQLGGQKKAAFQCAEELRHAAQNGEGLVAPRTALHQALEATRRINHVAESGPPSDQAAEAVQEALFRMHRFLLQAGVDPDDIPGDTTTAERVMASGSDGTLSTTDTSQ
jgi:hypothetical protein